MSVHGGDGFTVPLHDRTPDAEQFGSARQHDVARAAIDKEVSR
ncbi:hypothetical protein ACAG25_21775 [Mycobacterium sp. pV006]